MKQSINPCVVPAFNNNLNLLSHRHVTHPSREFLFTRRRAEWREEKLNLITVLGVCRGEAQLTAARWSVPIVHHCALSSSLNNMQTKGQNQDLGHLRCRDEESWLGWAKVFWFLVLGSSWLDFEVFNERESKSSFCWTEALVTSFLLLIALIVLLVTQTSASLHSKWTPNRAPHYVNSYRYHHQSNNQSSEPFWLSQVSILRTIPKISIPPRCTFCSSPFPSLIFCFTVTLTQNFLMIAQPVETLFLQHLNTRKSQAVWP